MQINQPRVRNQWTKKIYYDFFTFWSCNQFNIQMTIRWTSDNRNVVLTVKNNSGFEHSDVKNIYINFCGFFSPLSSFALQITLNLTWWRLTNPRFGISYPKTLSLPWSSLEIELKSNVCLSFCLGLNRWNIAVLITENTCM